MAKNGVFSWRRRSAKIGCLEKESSSSSSSIIPESHDHHHQLHVLAVDDSLVDRKLIERLLKITSCKVTAVDSGKKALQFLGLEEENSSDGFEGLKVDLIITDYCMPGMTGFELLKKIKGSSAFNQVPVVIMSSENVLARIDSTRFSTSVRSTGVINAVSACLEEGAEDFIVKPVKLSDVKRLKESMFGEDQKMDNIPQEDSTCKRKLHQVATTPSSEAVPASPSRFSSSPPPPPPPTSSSSPPLQDCPRAFSPATMLESPIRRIRLSN